MANAMRTLVSANANRSTPVWIAHHLLAQISVLVMVSAISPRIFVLVPQAGEASIALHLSAYLTAVVKVHAPLQVFASAIPISLVRTALNLFAKYA